MTRGMVHGAMYRQFSRGKKAGGRVIRGAERKVSSTAVTRNQPDTVSLHRGSRTGVSLPHDAPRALESHWE